MKGTPYEVRFGARQHVGTVLDPARGPSIATMTWMDRFDEVIEALRSPDFEQAGGGLRDSAAVIGGGLLSLSGPEHFARRKITGALFGRRQLVELESGSFMPRFLSELEACPVVAPGLRAADLHMVVRHALLEVSSRLVGLTLDGTRKTEDRLLQLMQAMAAGVNVEWIDRNHADVIADAERAMAEFDTEFVRPAWEIRAHTIARAQAGEIDEADLPLDLITLMILNEEHYAKWGAGTTLRETILFNGAPSSIPQAIAHTFLELERWCGNDPSRHARLVDRDFLRSACYEALRLHPATPFLIRRTKRDVTMRSGRTLAAGTYVVADIESANRDPAVYSDPERFDPDRRPADGVRAGALAFSSGPHTCIGTVMTLGEPRETDDSVRGIMVMVLRTLFERSARLDPEDRIGVDPDNMRDEYTRFPIVFSVAETGG